MKKYEFTVYGDTHFNTEYTIDEIKEFILNRITPMGISALWFNSFFIEEAIENNKAIGAREDTYYSNPKLTEQEKVKLDKALWELIKEGKIYYSFLDKVFKKW